MSKGTIRVLACAVLAMATASSCGAAIAQPASRTSSDTTLTVTATRDPVEKSYRKMIRGMDLFEAQRAMAPDAALRFRLLPRKRDTNMALIAIQVIGETIVVPVPVDADHTFTLPRDQEALDENALVSPNRKSQSMTWRSEIRTPGLPANTRRLGDLRLECAVGIEADLISNGRPLVGAIANFVVGLMDYCNRGETQYLFFADRPLFSVTLVAGARREILPVDRLYAGAIYDSGLKNDLPYCDCEVLVDRTYFLPLGDHSWPDDTLVEFEFMEDIDARR